jgi:polysaccharide deacetylase 2 family uncharacterized protein YibQ
MGPLIRFLRGYARELAFAGLAAFALWTGGAAALAGLPQLIGAVTPGLMGQAHADAPPVRGDIARLALPGFEASLHSPQLLYPVVANALPDWLTALRDAPARKPMIAIVMDDLGADIAGTEKAMRLPKQVALAFLPYAEMTPGFSARARDEGRTVLVHVPMQAVAKARATPMLLETGMAADEIVRRLHWSLDRVPGAMGLNNHEGSRFTADAAALAPVMAVVKARGLFFLDSKTSPASRAEGLARAAGIKTGGRDVFLDDDQSEAAVRAQITTLAAMAKRNGAAIAIGHPHATTLRLLAEWLKQDHGVTLVTLETAMQAKDARARALARQ